MTKVNLLDAVVTVNTTDYDYTNYYLHKQGIGLSTGYTETNYIDVEYAAPGRLQTKGYILVGGGTWYYTTSSALNPHTTSYTVIIHFTTPSALTYSVDPMIAFRVPGFYWVHRPSFSGYKVQFGGNLLGTVTFAFSTSTTYTLELIANADNQEVTCNIKNSSGTILQTDTYDYSGQTPVSESNTGLAVYAGNGVTPQYYDEYWYVEDISVSLGIGAYTGSPSYTDVSSYVKSIKIHKRMNSASEADLTFFSKADSILNLFQPNSQVSIRLGIDNPTPNYQFKGYIPPNQDYFNTVYIKGKDYYYQNSMAISQYGISGTVIEPASSDYPEDEQKIDSSEQEDMHKAERFYYSHSEPRFVFRASNYTFSIKCYDYISKLRLEYCKYDAITNLDNTELFSGLGQIVSNMYGGELTFSGGVSNPPILMHGTVADDWVSLFDLIEDQLGDIVLDDSLPDEVRKYYFKQGNFAGTTFDVLEYPNVSRLPEPVRNITETQILDFKRDRYKYSIVIADGFELDVGNVVFINTDEYNLKGHYVISEIIFDVSTTASLTTLVLDINTVTLR